MTNFEKIKNMSIEEMAQFLEEISSSCYATNSGLQKSGKFDFCKICPVYVPGEDCNIKRWLEREAQK